MAKKFCEILYCSQDCRSDVAQEQFIHHSTLTTTKFSGVRVNWPNWPKKHLLETLSNSGSAPHL